MTTEPSGLFLGVMDLKARHAEFSLRVVGVEGGEFSNPAKSPMSGDGLAVFVEDLDHLLGHAYPNHLAHVDKGNRVEVFLHLDMTVRMDLGRAPLTELERRWG